MYYVLMSIVVLQIIALILLAYLCIENSRGPLITLFNKTIISKKEAETEFDADDEESTDEEAESDESAF